MSPIHSHPPQQWPAHEHRRAEQGFALTISGDRVKT